MVDYREILWLYKENYNQKQIQSSIGISRYKRSEFLALTKACGIKWPLHEKLTNEAFPSVIFHSKCLSQSEYLEPDYAMIYKELARPGVTLNHLWNEYCRHCAAVGKQKRAQT